MYLARIEEGKVAAIYQVDDRQVRMPNAGREKPRATIETRRSKAWIFKSDRSALVAKLAKPGAAAIARTEPAAIAAAMRMYAQYMQSTRGRKR